MIECGTCGGYEFVDGEDGDLVRCPECEPEILICPVHRQKVMHRQGMLAGKCWGCVNENANALQWLRAHPYTGLVAA